MCKDDQTLFPKSIRIDVQESEFDKFKIKIDILSRNIVRGDNENYEIYGSLVKDEIVRGKVTIRDKFTGHVQSATIKYDPGNENKFLVETSSGENFFIIIKNLKRY